MNWGDVMGADLLIEFIIVAENDTPDDIKSRLLQVVNNLTIEKDEQNIKAFLDEVIGRNLNDGIDLDEVKEILTDIIDEAVAYLNEERRDIAWIIHKGDKIYLTGGMSWGDSPTDSYDVFYKFNILRECFETNED